MQLRNFWSTSARNLCILVTLMRCGVRLKQTWITNRLMSSSYSRLIIGVWCSEKRFWTVTQKSKWRNLVMWYRATSTRFFSFVYAKTETLKRTKAYCRLLTTTAIRNWLQSSRLLTLATIQVFSRKNYLQKSLAVLRSGQSFVNSISLKVLIRLRFFRPTYSARYTRFFCHRDLL